MKFYEIGLGEHSAFFIFFHLNILSSFDKTVQMFCTHNNKKTLFLHSKERHCFNQGILKGDVSLYN